MCDRLADEDGRPLPLFPQHTQSRRGTGRRSAPSNPDVPPRIPQGSAHTPRTPAHLDDDAISGKDRGGERVQDVVEGVVPGHNGAHHAHGVVLHARLLVEHLGEDRGWSGGGWDTWTVQAEIAWGEQAPHACQPWVHKAEPRNPWSSRNHPPLLNLLTM